jgi:hypothetical protein
VLNKLSAGRGSILLKRLVRDQEVGALNSRFHTSTIPAERRNGLPVFHCLSSGKKIHKENQQRYKGKYLKGCRLVQIRPESAKMNSDHCGPPRAVHHMQPSA